jgi:N-acyl-D-amino-acid deacylase
MTAARDAGRKLNEPLLKSQLEFTNTFFAKRRASLARGEPTGGRALTVSYGLWTYDIAGEEPTEVTDALVANLIKLQEPEGHWRTTTPRPPMSESVVSLTALAAYEVDRFARGEERKSAEKTIAKAKEFLAGATLVGTEDFAFRLWGLAWLEGSREEIDRARQALLATQRPDGGWAQLPDMDSDAYATGQALFILRDTGLPADSLAYQRGRDFLLKTQGEDGSWHVVTRAKPVQTYFDNGDPHGKDQFISIPATSWAVAALAKGGG